MFFRITLAAVLFAFVAGCASTGGGHWTNDWRNCMAAGATIGATAGGLSDADNAPEGLVAGAVIGSIVCALRAKDEDGDGVHDDADRCPGTFPGAEVDQHGCEPDLDGDGVPDRLDECPDTASGARVNAVGCEGDSDADGVLDSDDQCPGTPAGAKVDEFGCELDSDSDGVVDSKDKCPDTVAGTPVDNSGCDLQETYRMKNVHFAFDSAQLTSKSKASLDDALQILKRHEELVVEVAGHTDSVGSDSYNQALSQRRASAVRDYLVANGIAAGRLTAKGYGESEPVADNSTDEGRAQNRRVELRQK
ncbi:MAG: OmpA family protein [Xanthomonadales bacterium]|nr:OmpA family protein [Xanthomonadales bacterium]